MSEVYVSTDVETDGPIPGVNSMLSFGSAAYLPDKTLINTFTANLETLPGAVADPRTMAWWETQPEAWIACREDLQPPDTAMEDYLAWLKLLPGRPVFVGYPAAFDFMFMCWYLTRFTGQNPFSHSALDIKTYAMAMLKIDFRDTVKRNMPRRWFDNLPHTHKALDDAIEQGALFCNMLRESREVVDKMAKKKTDIPFRADEYAYRVQYSPDDQAFIGLVDEFPGLSAFSGTLEGAVKEIKTVVSEGLRSLAERGEQIPEPLSRREYSGKFVVRLDPALHRQLAIEATRKGVSLNEHVREKLASA